MFLIPEMWAWPLMFSLFNVQGRLMVNPKSPHSIIKKAEWAPCCRRWSVWFRECNSQRKVAVVCWIHASWATACRYTFPGIKLTFNCFWLVCTHTRSRHTICVAFPRSQWRAAVWRGVGWARFEHRAAPDLNPQWQPPSRADEACAGWIAFLLRDFSAHLTSLLPYRPLHVLYFPMYFILTNAVVLLLVPSKRWGSLLYLVRSFSFYIMWHSCLTRQFYVHLLLTVSSDGWWKISKVGVSNKFQRTFQNNLMQNHKCIKNIQYKFNIQHFLQYKKYFKSLTILSPSQTIQYYTYIEGQTSSSHVLGVSVVFGCLSVLRLWTKFPNSREVSAVCTWLYSHVKS